MLLVQAQRESGLNTAAVHQNLAADGKVKSTDYGIMQINSGNFALLGLRSPAEAMDPCRNLRAASDLYQTLSRYNSGNPTVSISYANAIISGTRLVKEPGTETPISPADQTDPQPPAWNLEAVADWRRRHAPTAEDAASDEAAPETAIVEPTPKQGEHK